MQPNLIGLLKIEIQKRIIKKLQKCKTMYVKSISTLIRFLLRKIDFKLRQKSAREDNEDYYTRQHGRN